MIHGYVPSSSVNFHKIAMIILHAINFHTIATIHTKENVPHIVMQLSYNCNGITDTEAKSFNTITGKLPLTRCTINTNNSAESIINTIEKE